MINKLGEYEDTLYGSRRPKRNDAELASLPPFERKQAEYQRAYGEFEENVKMLELETDERQRIRLKARCRAKNKETLEKLEELKKVDEEQRNKVIKKVCNVLDIFM